MLKRSIGGLLCRQGTHSHSLPFRLNHASATSATSDLRPDWASYEEPIAKYEERPGFLPLVAGQKLGDYTILRKLGWGVYSTVWLAEREQDRTLAALKVMSTLGSKHLPELEFLQRMRSQSPAHPGSSHVAHLIDHFYCSQGAQDNLCLALEPLSESLHTFSKRWIGSRLPPGVVRRVVRQVVQAVDFLHTECNIIHTDIKPDNIMLAISSAELRAAIAAMDGTPVDRSVTQDGREVVRTPSSPIAYPIPPGDICADETWRGVQGKLSDLGVSCWADRTGGHFMEPIQSPALRAPEVCIGAGWGRPADIWSIGCLAYQLSMGRSLLPETIAEVSVPSIHAILFGEYPEDLLKSGKHSRMFYLEDGTLRYKENVRISVAEMVKRDSPADAELLIDFLNTVFVLDPAHRPTAKELLKHKWLSL
ncbi:kinase-like protein [Phanerochaete sordida]|uniref:non-specific serine/threonine protein kinase n=1 Tax=Phanerochaete sordida TaxID=48140 RepID=A0A9P3G894_9APHY|nr:kinase-like protein [Phanerochaete sordida]